LVIAIFTVFLTSNISNLLSNTSITNNESINSKKNIDPILTGTSQLQWVKIPGFNLQYFSPDSSPGIGDTVTYSFAVDIDDVYTLKISAYYDAIDNYTGPISTDPIGVCSAAYLMPNKTWLIAAIDTVPPGSTTNLRLGIGLNASNIVWRTIGQINTTDYLAIAGDDSNKIRIVYFENSTHFSGIKCLSSNDWGKNWNSEILHNYSPFKLDIRYYGISIAAFKGNFTCVWGASLRNFDQESTIIKVEELDGAWMGAENLTAFEGEYAVYPQVFFNQTNNDGTLFVACDIRSSFIATQYNSTLRRLSNGINARATHNWTYDPYTNGCNLRPLTYWAKDYQKNIFYVIDVSDPSITAGIINATWNQDISNFAKDKFHSEAERSFNLYGYNGPKCFTGQAKSVSAYYTLGILDCLAPFTVREIIGSTSGFLTETIFFDGKDNEGRSRNALAYMFSLKVSLDPSQGIFDSILYVDNIPPNILLTNTSNFISPFSSPGFNDEFRINFESDKDGIVSFTISSADPTIKTTKLSKNLASVLNPVLFGDGLNNYLIFIEYDEPVFSLMLSRSFDGGLSWESPTTLKASTEPFISPVAISEGFNLYIWTQSGPAPILLGSSDNGDTFFETIVYSPVNAYVQAVTEDLKCFYGVSNMSIQDDWFIINKTNDLGKNWNDQLCTVNIPNASNYSLDDAAWDPISGNYSFLLMNNLNQDVRFLSVTADGSAYTLSNNLSQGSNNNFPSLTGMFDLEVLYNGSTSEWIITTTARNEIIQPGSISSLEYITSPDGVNFSPWNNYTALTGDNLLTYTVHHKNWDIIFPDGAFPCYVTGVSTGGGSADYFNITGKSTFVYGDEKELDENLKAILSFRGLTLEGDFIEDGNYSWVLRFIDLASYEVEKKGFIFLDNNDPELLSGPVTSPVSPFPVNDTIISVLIREENYDTGILQWRIPSGSWNTITMTVDDSNIPNVNFSATIPSQIDTITTVFWKIIINDTCGNKILIDNNGLTYSYSSGIFSYTKISEILSPTLYNDWNWTYIFSSGVDHLDKVWVRMEYNDGTPLTDLIINGDGDNNATFSLFIPHDTDHNHSIYKFMYRTDTGQERTIEEIEMFTPNIDIEELIEPPDVLDLLEDDSITVEFIIDFSIYIDFVDIEYEFDDGKGIQTAKLLQEGTVFSYTFDEFPEEATLLTYNIIAKDIYGNDIELGKEREIKLLPKPPTLELTTETQLLVSFIALIVGVCSGLLFSTITGRKTPKRKINAKLFKIQKFKEREINGIIDKERKNITIEKTAAEKKIKLLSGLSAFGFIVSFSLAEIAFLVLQNMAIAILMFILSFLLTIVLWIYLSANTVEKHLHSLNSKPMWKDKILLMGISILIYVSLLAIFMVGNEIAWWRVRVAQNSIDFLGFSLPRALMTVTTTFFSSIFLLTWSTFKQVSKKDKELRKAISLNENPLNIIERKEEAIYSVISNVGKKGIVFIALITVVIIFSSDLSVYANQGLLILIPFVIGGIGILMLNTLIKRRKESPIKSDAVVLDHIISCPHCEKDTPLGGNYCEHCGEKLLKGQRFSEGIRCIQCKRPNTVGAFHCRYCGAELGNKKKNNNSDNFNF